MSKNKLNTISNIKDVINDGFCIGCGTCTAINSEIKINTNSFGEFEAILPKKQLDTSFKEASLVCPFSAKENENELASEVFDDLAHDEKIGHYLGLYAGFSNENRLAGSSGGIGTHLLKRLLEKDLVDKVIVVGQNEDSNEFEFNFQVISNSQSLEKYSTSFYYPVSYADALIYIKENPGRYAITGVPCFNKSLRLLKKQDPVFSERIVFQIGIVCGQMKSKFYLEYLLRKSSFSGTLASASFRKKNLNEKASNYSFQSKNTNSEIFEIKNNKVGANWAMGLFKPKACDFCDDVLAECADISIMDAWLPKYVSDSKGTSLIVNRNKILDKILLEEHQQEDMYLEKVTVDEVIESQASGLNHRREGLSYRLHLYKGKLPKKRVSASNAHSKLFRVDHLLRISLRVLSRSAMRLQIKCSSKGLFIYYSIMKIPLFIFRKFSKFKKIYE